METAPKASLIIPVYNKAPFLERCLDSIEPVEGLEVIIIDDNSTDGSKAILEAYKDKFQIIYRKNNYGVSSTRNYGMQLAKGRYIAFLDADDALVPGATTHMVKMAENKMSHNIIQYGQYVCKQFPVRILRTARRGWYDLLDLPRNNWVLVWNKLYRREFLEKNGFKFREDLTFGEDEIFNVEALIVNDGMWVVGRALVEHHLDDMESICRGGLCLEWLQILHSELKAKLENAKSEKVKLWLESVIRVHENSKTFKRFGFHPKIKERKGKYDVVYMLKDTPTNPELRYSIRSVVENFPHRKIVFCGGKPKGLNPDLHIKVKQDQPSKWENVRELLKALATDDRVSKDFWLFNDDFFALEPISEDVHAYYDKNITDVIEKTERGFGHPIDWTKRLRHLLTTLASEDLPSRNYAVHKPMLMNRKKLAELLDKFPDEPMTRALYGNYYHMDGEGSPDYKVRVTKYDLKRVRRWNFVSTQDDSFSEGNIGEYLREKFPTPTRIEEAGLIKVQPICRYYDSQLHKDLDQYSRAFEVDLDRAEFLAERGLVKFVV